MRTPPLPFKDRVFLLMSRDARNKATLRRPSESRTRRPVAGARRRKAQSAALVGSARTSAPPGSRNGKPGSLVATLIPRRSVALNLCRFMKQQKFQTFQTKTRVSCQKCSRGLFPAPPRPKPAVCTSLVRTTIFQVPKQSSNIHQQSNQTSEWFSAETFADFTSEAISRPVGCMPDAPGTQRW